MPKTTISEDTPDKRLVTVATFCELYVDLKPYTVRKKIREGIIPAGKPGRYLIDPDEAIAALKRERTNR